MLNGQCSGQTTSGRKRVACRRTSTAMAWTTSSSGPTVCRSRAPAARPAAATSIFGSTTRRVQADSSVDQLGRRERQHADRQRRRRNPGGWRRQRHAHRQRRWRRRAATAAAGNDVTLAINVASTLDSTGRSPSAAAATLGQLARVDGGNGVDTLQLEGSGLLPGPEHWSTTRAPAPRASTARASSRSSASTSPAAATTRWRSPWATCWTWRA